MRGGRRYQVPRRPRIRPSAFIAPVAQHRGGNTQLACDPAQRPTAAHQQGYRFPLELIRKMTPSLAHSTPFRSHRSLAKVSTNSREAQSCPKGRRTPTCGKRLPGLLQACPQSAFLHEPRSGAPERRRGCVSRREFRCFRCFSTKLSASEVSSSAEILGRGRSGDRENSKTSAVPPLFFA